MCVGRVLGVCWVGVVCVCWGLTYPLDHSFAIDAIILIQSFLGVRLGVCVDICVYVRVCVTF